MAVTSATSSPVAERTSEPAGNTKLDREAFLKLLVAQISHQDPLNPLQGTEFVAQLSQFSIVEQSIQQTQHLSMLSQQLTGLSNGEASALVGKQVSMRGKAISFDGTTATAANVTLSGPAAKVTAVLRDGSGAVVRTLELGASRGGTVSVQWDGRDDAGQLAPAGSYSFEVKAVDAAGAPVEISQDVTGVVTKVSFEKGYPELVLDSGAVGPISDLVSVGIAPAR
jgi:flagellar basal-body rod modification protein FlgD